MDEGEQCEPHYGLGQFQGLVRGRRYQPTGEARSGLFAFGDWDEDDLVACILALQAADFHKSMPSRTMPGTWQDVYKPFHRSRPVYVKLQINETWAIIIQFKEGH